jgi:hypothetical protein
MTGLSIDPDWAEYSGTDRPELLATYANLAIRVDDEIVTSVHHRNSHTTSDRVLLSVYPLAEWIAGHWWFLTDESDGPKRLGFLDRHALNRGRSGYCVPDLRFVPEGESFQVEWVPYSYVYAPVDFISGGRKTLLKQHVEDTLRDFVDSVDERLSKAGITDSWMQQEWAAVREAEADAEQVRFCRAAAWLGLDPFDLSEQDARKIKQLADKLPPELREDAFRAAGPESPEVIADWVATELASNPSGRWDKAEIMKVQDQLHSAANGLPWEIGYKLAQRVRDVRPELAETPTRLESLFGGELPVLVGKDAPQAVDGLVLAEVGFECRTNKRRPDSQRFLVARAIFDFVRLQQGKSLLTAARTTRQSESRAFAAELLAPAVVLRDRLKSGWATQDQVSDLADKLGVSYVVVEHQIRNHRIATISV